MQLWNHSKIYFAKRLNHFGKPADNRNVMENTLRVLPFSLTKAAPAAMPGPVLQSVAAKGLSDQDFVLSGPSPATAKLWSQLQRVAPYFRIALLSGEEGTGAEFAARALHEASPFRDKMLRVLSVESAELYFSPGGAFARGGGHGAYFFEHVDQLSPAAQQGLLQLARLRGNRSACIIAFSSTDLRSLISAGKFSAELGMALGGLRLQMPSFRERREDIPSLAHAVTALLAKRNGREALTLSPDFLEAASSYEWPRNLDQMGEMISWMLHNRPGTAFGREDFEAACAVYEPKEDEPERSVRMVKLETMVQEHIRAVLQACNGNKQKAAEVLGISRSTLYRMLDAGTPFLAKAC